MGIISRLLRYASWIRNDRTGKAMYGFLFTLIGIFLFIAILTGVMAYVVLTAE